MKQTLGPRIFGGVDNEAGFGWTWGEEEEAWSRGFCRGVDKIMGMGKILARVASACLLACLPGVIEAWPGRRGGKIGRGGAKGKQEPGWKARGQTCVSDWTE